MISDSLSYARKVFYQRNSKRAQVLFWAYAGEHEQFRGVENAGCEDYLVLCECGAVV